MNNKEYDRGIDIKLFLTEFLSNFGKGKVRVFTDPIADQLSKWTSEIIEKDRIQLYTQYIENENLSFSELHDVITDYTLYLFVSNIGFAQYKYHKSVLSSMLYGVYTKISSNDFWRGFDKKCNDNYKCATISIAYNIKCLLTKLYDQKLISTEENDSLNKEFILRTHVKYSLLAVRNMDTDQSCSLYHVIKYYSQKDIVNYFRNKYKGYDLIANSLSTDDCSFFFKEYSNNVINFFDDKFYD